MKFHGSLSIALSLCLAAPAVLLAADAKKNAAPPAPPAPADAPAQKAFVLPETVATVDGSAIKKEELEKEFNNVLAAQKISAASLPDDQRIQGYRMLLDDMITNKLLSKASADTKVSDDEVNTQFDRIKKNFGSEDELKKQVEAAGETIDKVKTGLRDRLREEHWIDSQVGDKAKVTDAEAEDFYKQNPDKFKMPEQVRASHILVKIEPDATPQVVTAKEKAAQAIADRVKKGEDFAKLAKELSEDPSAKENSGDLNFFTREQMVPEFSKAAFAMKKGEISDPVRSEFGYHIIKVTDRKDAETVSLEKVKPQLVAFLGKQKKQEAIEKVLQEVRSKADVKINLPEPPAPSVPAPGAAPAPAPAAAK
jgi:parvulin-like peptidyl-prolyl isomerase